MNIVHCELFGQTVREMSGYLSATDLTTICNYNRLKEWKGAKRLDDYLASEATREVMDGLTERLKVEKLVIAESGITWMHPHLFIDYAMWLNPELVSDTIRGTMPHWLDTVVAAIDGR